MLSKKLLRVCCLLILCQTIASAALLEDKRIGFTVPAAPWTLTLLADDFVIEQQKIEPDGRWGSLNLTDDGRRLRVSMFIGPAGFCINSKCCKDSKSCRDFRWKAAKSAEGKPQNVIQSEIGDVSFVEFLIPSFKGQPLRTQHMYAEFVVDGFWVDFHIWKHFYKPEEHELFEQMIKSIKFEPKKGSKP